MFACRDFIEFCSAYLLEIKCLICEKIKTIQNSKSHVLYVFAMEYE